MPSVSKKGLKERKVTSEDDDFSIEGLSAGIQKERIDSSGHGVSVAQVQQNDSDDGNGIQPMGTFIEYTISNKLNQASQGGTNQRIFCFEDICMLLKPYVACIPESFQKKMDMGDALDNMIRMSGARIAVRNKRAQFIKSGQYKDIIADDYLDYIKNLAMQAINEATVKGIISLAANLKAEYGMVMFDQGGGFRPQPKRY